MNVCKTLSSYPSPEGEGRCCNSLLNSIATTSALTLYSAFSEWFWTFQLSEKRGCALVAFSRHCDPPTTEKQGEGRDEAVSQHFLRGFILSNSPKSRGCVQQAPFRGFGVYTK